MYDVFVNFIKAACGLSKKSKEQIVDIDAADVNYELAVLEYVEDIYSFYKLAELNDFVCISDKTYSHEQVLTMEKQIHEQLEWYLTVPTPYVFLVRSIKASLPDSEFCDWSTYLQLLHPSGNDSGNLCTSMLHCVKLVVVDKVAVVGEVKLAMWNPHCLPISRLLLQADELIPMDSTVSGYATTSLFSKAVWVSINPLLSTGYQSPLKLDEVPLLPPDFQAEFRLCSMRLMKLPKMLNRTWSIMPELRSSLPRSRQGNTTNKNKQKLPVVLPSLPQHHKCIMHPRKMQRNQQSNIHTNYKFQGGDAVIWAPVQSQSKTEDAGEIN
ncbi:G2/mitotic-specific cyclin S13-7 [Capsicum annuum]|uniref:G2/mitotic-specific cyclin S13-7 n=1 Tax=Capsicum annuum TaxID=4072 RepID=A0A2G2YVA5_CAPAN|nr:G2/mitotic-specific cyclin S13-7 [Capsicum annuum]